MVFIKDVSGNLDAGTATQWGGNDINFIDDYFDDIDITPKVAKINTRTYFRSGKFEWRNPANTFSYIVVAGAIVANRNLNIPVIGTDATFLLDAVDNNLGDHFLDVGDISTPSNPSAGIRRLFVDSGTGKLSVRTSAGATVSLEESAAGAGDMLLGTAQTVTAAKTFNDTTFLLRDSDNTHSITIRTPNLAANRDLSIPAITANDTLAVKGLNNAFSTSQDITGTVKFGTNLRQAFDDTDATTARTQHLPNVNTALVGAGISQGGDITVSNTVTETNLISYTIPANSMGTNGFVRVVMRGFLFQNQATATTYTIRIKIAGTSIWGDVSLAVGQNATRLPLRIEFDVYNRNSNTSTACNGFVMWNDGQGASVAGIGDISDDETSVFGSFDSEGNGYTGGMTSDRTLTVTVEHSVASTSVQTVIKHYSIEQVTFN